MPQQYYPEAQWRPGPSSKIGYPLFGTGAPKRGVVTHSAEGWRQGLLDALRDLERRASWTFSLLLDGTVWQHYEVTANAWHAGDIDDDGAVRANIDLEGWEFEGMAGTPINDLQVAAAASLYRWHQKEHGWQDYQLWSTVYHHSWVSDLPTWCPSNRIRHVDIAAQTIRLGISPPRAEEEEEDDMKVIMIRVATNNVIWLTDWIERRLVISQEEINQLRYIGVLGPVTVPPNMLSSIVIRQ